MSSLRARVGRVVRRYREMAGLTQEALASAAALHRNYPSEIERGQRNVGLDTLERITHVLGVTLGTFFAEVDALGDPPVHAHPDAGNAAGPSTRMTPPSATKLDAGGPSRGVTLGVVSPGHPTPADRDPPVSPPGAGEALEGAL